MQMAYHLSTFIGALVSVTVNRDTIYTLVGTVVNRDNKFMLLAIVARVLTRAVKKVSEQYSKVRNRTQFNVKTIDNNSSTP